MMACLRLCTVALASLAAMSGCGGGGNDADAPPSASVAPYQMNADGMPSANRNER